MQATPFIRRGLLAFAAVATLLIGFTGSANAQNDEEEASGIFVITESPISLELLPPIPIGDVTSEGTLIGVPNTPVVIAPAPVANPPQTGSTAPAVAVDPGDVPEHASIWSPIFGCDPLLGIDPSCVRNP